MIWEGLSQRDELFTKGLGTTGRGGGTAPPLLAIKEQPPCRELPLAGDPSEVGLSGLEWTPADGQQETGLPPCRRKDLDPASHE